jgi:hypothetical protein
MKKITLLTLFVALSIFSFGQSLSLTGATTPVAGDPNSSVEGLVTITNISSASVDILVERTANNLAVGHTSNFCWGINCYGDATSITPVGDEITLAAGQDTDCFHGWLNPHGFEGQSSVTYNFFNMNNLNDNVTQTFVYDMVTGIPIAGVSLVNPLSEASPNPANSLTGINYVTDGKSNSKIIIYNLLGTAVKEVRLNNKQGSLILATSDLDAGVYYYSLVSGSKTLSTKKLVIAHK